MQTGGRHISNTSGGDVSAKTASIDWFQACMNRTYARLEAGAAEWNAAFRSAQPYPFVAIDNFLDQELAERVLAEFPDLSSEAWQKLKGVDQKNKAVLGREQFLKGVVRELLHELNSGACVELLAKITGIPGLMGDPYLLGGGLHQIARGGKLNVHVDYSHHPDTRLARRLNLIVYLNKDWRDEYAGHFELWDRKMTKCEHRIAPTFNRAVIFATSSYSYHGHPDPLACPEGTTRKSMALYYYSNGRGDEEGPEIEHNTLFYTRPGERFSLGNWFLRTASSGFVRDVMPPIFYRALRSAWNAKVLTKKKSNDS